MSTNTREVGSIRDGGGPGGTRLACLRPPVGLPCARASSVGNGTALQHSAVQEHTLPSFGFPLSFLIHFVSFFSFPFLSSFPFPPSSLPLPLFLFLFLSFLS